MEREAILVKFSIDIRLIVRQLRMSPGFAAVSILSLALGIGATATVFSVIYGALVAPYPYRGPYGYDDADGGKKYADDVKDLIDYATPGKLAGFIAESIQGVGGSVVFPEGYLKHAYEYVRAAGGLCISACAHIRNRPH